jgi:guanine nucleotide-binding protein subunit alpha, other
MCFGSREKSDSGMARSREIDKGIRQDEKRLAKEVKLLLLGAFSLSRAASRIAPSLRCDIQLSSMRLRHRPACTNRAPTGAGESGKSTILKQMKLIYAQGFSKNERLEWRPVVFNNVVQSFKTISEAMTELDIAFENPDNEVSILNKTTPFLQLPIPYRNDSPMRVLGPISAVPNACDRAIKGGWEVAV